MQSDCLTLWEYDRIAVRYLSKVVPSARKNPDHINHVIEYMLRADVSFDQVTGSLKGRRMTYAKFAAQHIKAKLGSKKYKGTLSLDKVFGGENSRAESSGNSIVYNDLTPLDQADFNEMLEFINSDEFSSLESCAVTEYYLEKVPMLEIAAKYNVTRMAVWLAIERALDKIREKYGEEESGRETGN